MSDSAKGGGPSSGKEDVYQVEKIVRRRNTKGKVFYLLKWVGYPHSDNSWVEEGDLHCPDLVAEFERVQEKGKKKGRKPAKRSSQSVANTAWSVRAKGATSEVGSGERATIVSEAEDRENVDKTIGEGEGVNEQIGGDSMAPPSPKNRDLDMDDMADSKRKKALVPGPKKVSTKKARSGASASAPSVFPKFLTDDHRGYDYGDRVDYIIGANLINADSTSKKKIMLLVKWKKSGSSSWLPSTIVNKKDPQKVIQFYEAHISS
eukprot:CAMPEP_0119124350 /NCGR_PEP_ID=MMETSP1310-20130426/4001_1 /TAXON_ID=464262 /ORGANISM="Genus nov. species nov., Strain RCC2339" /LENGTH=261 /DNA_ID=CAMNT_0007114291 /DNA_START=142 /DNA_END=924 /DNA_ORIENTATION=+